MSGSAVLPRPHAATLRAATATDLPALNGVVERAVMTWKLAERVKRLSLPSHRYHAHDLLHLTLVLAEATDGRVVGVAAWEEAAARELPAGRSGLLLHGLYVDPARQHEGIGSRLLAAAAAAARERGLDGVLVRAQADAVGFFAARGLTRLPVVDALRDYPHRYWLALEDAPDRH
jgi:GNAT superfamily N-acetyltransferase